MPDTHPHKAVFLDRDCTVIEDMHFSTDPAKIKALPGALEGMRQFQEAGYTLVIITNQSGIARGLFSEEELQTFHETLKAWLAERGVNVAGIYYCPHYPNGKLPEYSIACDCRKPAPGMILQAAGELALDLPNSWMIGDRDCDTAAGRNAGCRTVLVETALEPQPQNPKPEFFVRSVRDAAEIILGTSSPEA